MRMMSSSPLVSVVIPTYYRQSVVSAVESVLDQTYKKVEIIVVDDSGEGHAEQWLDAYGEAYYCKLDSNKGANTARQIGFEQSSGDYIHFLDDDDEMEPQKIEKSVEMFWENNSASVVYSGVEFDGELHLPDQNCCGEVLKQALQFEMWPCMTSTMLIQRAAIKECDIFANLPGADDLQMMIELAKTGEFEYVNDVLVRKTRSPDARGASKGAFEGRFEIIERYSNLYRRYPDIVREKAISEAEFNRAKYFLNNTIWSGEAIKSMARHCWNDPNPGVLCVLKLASSVFGKLGWKLSNWAYDVLSKNQNAKE